MGRETNKQRRDKQAATAREKAAAARASQARIDQRRRARTILSSVVAVVVVVAVIAVVAITQSGKVKNDPAGDRTAASPAIVSDVTDVSSSSTDTIGQGNADLSAVKAISDPALTSDGKPELLFIGGEFCPFCAAERWSIINALSRFGTFKNLNQIRSATSDENLATFSFYKSSYSSKYLSFVPVENRDRANDQTDLVPVTAAQKAIWTKYTQQSFPFMDFGGQYVVTNAGYPDTDLSGLNWTQITNDLKDPTSKIAKDILGEANVLTAMVCKLTNGQPGNVCTASGPTKVTLPQPSA